MAAGHSTRILVPVEGDAVGRGAGAERVEAASEGAPNSKRTPRAKHDRRDAQGQLRELHLDRALDVINYGEQPPAGVAPRPLGEGRALLVECPYFAMERWELRTPLDRATTPDSFEILTAIHGAAQLAWGGGKVDLARGESLVLPASLGAYQLRPQPGATLLACYVP